MGKVGIRRLRRFLGIVLLLSNEKETSSVILTTEPQCLELERIIIIIIIIIIITIIIIIIIIIITIIITIIIVYNINY